MGLTRITSDGITDAAIVNADINGSAAIAGTKISPDFGSQAITTTGTLACGDITSSDGNGNLTLKDNNHTGSNCEHLINFTASDDTSLMNIGTPFGSNALFFKYGSTELVKIDANAQVDFAGNVDCNAGLDVTGGGLTVNTGTTNTCATFTSTDAGAVINITDNSARSSIEQNGTDLKIISDTDAGDADSTIKFQVDASTKMTLDSSGRLLIGTTTVGAKGAASPLQIQTADSGAFALTIKNRSSNNDYGFIGFTDDDASEDLCQIGVQRTAANTGDIFFYTNGGSSSSTERLRIDSSGDLSFSMEASSNYPTQQIKWSNDSTTTNGFYIAQHSDRNGRIWHEQGLSLAFGTSNTERMRIDHSGNVGINESSPSSELVVKANDSNESAIQILAGGNGKESQLLFAAPDDADVGSIRYDHNGDVMKFTVATGERMRLSSSGNFFHGRTSNIVCNSVNTSNNFEQIDSFTWTLGLHADQAHKIGLAILYSSTNNNHDFIRCHVSGSGGRFVVESDGDCFNQNGSFSSLSDISLKENVVDAKSQWNDIKNLKVRNFNFKESTGRPTHTQIGLVAQELEIVCPNLVKESEEGLKTVANSVLYMKAIKCLQEAMTKIETLETEVAALKAG